MAGLLLQAPVGLPGITNGNASLNCLAIARGSGNRSSSTAYLAFADGSASNAAAVLSLARVPP